MPSPIGASDSPDPNEQAMKKLVESLAAEQDASSSDLQETSEAELAYEGVVAEALAERGVVLPCFEQLGGATGRSMIDVASGLIETGQADLEHDWLLLLQASAIAGVAADLQTTGTADGTVPEAKAREQVAILDEALFEPQEQAVLLEVLDLLVPVVGIDVTHPTALSDIRDAQELLELEHALVRQTGERVGTIIRDELVPTFGRHASYSQLQRFITEYYRYSYLPGRGVPADKLQAKLLGQSFLNKALELAAAMHIPEQTILSVIERASRPED